MSVQVITVPYAVKTHTNANAFDITEEGVLKLGNGNRATAAYQADRWSSVEIVDDK